MKRLLMTTACLIVLGMAVNGVNAGTMKDKKDADILQSPAKTLKWIKTPFGPFASPVSGNFAEGSHVTLIRFTAGMKTPVHTHSHDYVGIVLKGVSRHYSPEDGSSRAELPAGSHWSVKANVPHISECLPGQECVMALYQSAAFDFLPTEK